MSKPVAVLISDVHYNLKNLELSDAAMNAAIKYGEINSLPVIVAGDLHDTKALMRGEVVSRMIKTFSNRETPIIVMIGNHDRINEKSPLHSLEFLKPYVNLIDKPTSIALQYTKHKQAHLNLIPYHSENEKIKLDYPKGSILIMHQGVTQGDKGEYVFDRSAIDVARLKDYTAISGHYHRHHTVGTLTYIGSPFTMSFAESNDGPKGFLVVNEDGTFKQEVLNFRKHIIWGVGTGGNTQGCLEYMSMLTKNKNDILWMKLTGPKSELDKISKKKIAEYIGREDFKLDKIPDESLVKEKINIKLTGEEILDKLIEGLSEKKEQKEYLKTLWRGLV